ncbi:MAG: putative enzyme with PLP-binding domain alanine racemase [Alphaproteobacteria bacterium]|jgi:pyridoxal phosphate enzyme (YggS family)|nr:putative enzyme with PLP-binding domain alanine racemase [Alphaproteobacteria bacterium]
MLSGKNRLGFHQVYESIRETCQATGRFPHAVSLLAVSKNQGDKEIVPLLKAGQRWFGENRVQEAAAKWPKLREQYPGLRLHLIAPLQTNKIRQTLELFDVIESVDRPSLVLKLAKEWENPKRITTKLLIQVNTGREPQKSGVLPEDLPALVDLCQRFSLPLTGLMGIPPVDDDPAPHFQLLADLAHYYNLPDLSMGMSGDYPIAIAHGATWVRVGKALWAS